MGATVTVKIKDNNADLEQIKTQIERAIAANLGIKPYISIQKIRSAKIGNANFSKPN